MFPCKEEKIKWDEYGEFIKYDSSHFIIGLLIEMFNS